MKVPGVNDVIKVIKDADKENLTKIEQYIKKLKNYMDGKEKIDFYAFPTTPGFEVIVRMPEEKKEEKKEPVYDGGGINGPTFIVSLDDEIRKEWIHHMAKVCIKNKTNW